MQPLVRSLTWTAALALSAIAGGCVTTLSGSDGNPPPNQPEQSTQEVANQTVAALMTAGGFASDIYGVAVSGQPAPIAAPLCVSGTVDPGPPLTAEVSLDGCLIGGVAIDGLILFNGTAFEINARGSVEVEGGVASFEAIDVVIELGDCLPSSGTLTVEVDGETQTMVFSPETVAGGC